MPKQARRTGEDKTARAATVLASENLTGGREVAGRRAREAAAAVAAARAALRHEMPTSELTAISRHTAYSLAELNAALDQNADDVLASMDQAMKAGPDEPDPDEAEALALLDSFDGRIKEIEQRIDRVLARMGVG